MKNRFEYFSSHDDVNVYNAARLAFFNAANAAQGNLYDFGSARALLIKNYPQYEATIRRAERDVEAALERRNG